MSTRFAPSQSSEPLGWIALITLCLFTALLGRFCYVLCPFDTDAGIFIYEGKMVAEGGRLGHEVVDNKFPTVGLMTSLPWRIFTNHWAGYVLLQTALALAGALMLGRIAARHAGPHAFWPTTLFAMVFLNFTVVVFGGFQLETLLAFFVILTARSALIAVETDNPADAFVAGLAGSCAAMLKPTGLAVLVAMIVALWFALPKRAGIWRHLLAIAVGLAIPLGASLIYLVQADLLREMPALWRQIAEYAAASVWSSSDWIKPVTAVVLLGFPILVWGWIYRRQRSAQTRWPAAPVIVFTLIWLGLEIAGVLMQRRMYRYHFLTIIPPAALLFGLFPRIPRPRMLAAALLPAIVMSVIQAGWVIHTYAGDPPRSALSEYLAGHTSGGDAFWMESWPRVMLETGLRPGARVPIAFIFTNTDRAPLDYASQMLGDFGRIKPKYILLPAPLEQRVINQADSIPELKFRPQRRANYIKAWSEIRDYTLAHYVRETQIDGQTIYRRAAETGPVYTAAPSE